MNQLTEKWILYSKSPLYKGVWLLTKPMVSPNTLQTRLMLNVLAAVTKTRSGLELDWDWTGTGAGLGLDWDWSWIGLKIIVELRFRCLNSVSG